MVALGEDVGLDCTCGVASCAVLVLGTLLAARPNSHSVSPSSKRRPYFCGDVTCGTAVLDVLERGVGRTGAPDPIIHDFCLAPLKSVFKVAFDESTSRSVTPGWRSLSGAVRIAQREGIRVRMRFEVDESRLGSVSASQWEEEENLLYHQVAGQED